MNATSELPEEATKKSAKSDKFHFDDLFPVDSLEKQN